MSVITPMYAPESKQTTTSRLHNSDSVNSTLPGQNDSHLADVIFRCIFFNEKLFTLIKISLKSVSKGPIVNNTALV